MDPLECLRKPDQAAANSIPCAIAHLLDFIRCALYYYADSLSDRGQLHLGIALRACLTHMLAERPMS